MKQGTSEQPAMPSPLTLTTNLTWPSYGSLSKQMVKLDVFIFFSSYLVRRTLDTSGNISLTTSAVDDRAKNLSHLSRRENSIDFRNLPPLSCHSTVPEKHDLRIHDETASHWNITITCVTLIRGDTRTRRARRHRDSKDGARVVLKRGKT